MGVVAYFVLLLYPAVVVCLFLTLKPIKAVLWTYLIGWLFLPLGEINLPGLPSYGKFSASSIVMLPSVLLFDPGRLSKWRFSWVDIAAAVWIVAPFFASIANGLGSYDGMSGMVNHLLLFGIPFFLGRLYFSDDVGRYELSRGILMAAAIYTPLCLIEMRMAPQFHSWTYGYSGRSSWSYDGKFGPLGWTPAVFMNSSFEIALLMTMATLVAFWNWRTDKQRFLGYDSGFVFSAFSVMVVLCKKLTGVGLSALGVSLLMTRSRAIRIGVASLPVVYVLLFTSGVWRGEGLSDYVAMYSEERAESLQFRLDNDQRLVEKALQNPLFGWGGWGRNRIYDENGKDISITDSMFLIILGTMGLTGIASQMAIYLYPAILCFMGNRCDRPMNSSSIFMPHLPLAVILVLHSFDNLFNAFPNSIYPMIAGGLAVWAQPTQDENFYT